MAVTNDILRVTLSGTMANLAVWQNVFHYRVTSGSELDYDVILAAIKSAFDTAYALLEGVTHEDVESVEMILAEWDFSDNEFDGKAQVTASPLDGAITAQALPNGNTAVVRFFTDELRRQARKFLPGISEAHSNANALESSYLVAAALWAVEIVKDITAGGVVIRPCTFNDTPLSPRFETSSDFTTSFVVNTQGGYQRNRQPGAGI